uniref:Uncharacterized protein n=1 Tax=Attheya septentrionalis TaxID=420275 RepID=A0A7S2UK43_9STRA|mmetsp:Transcript_25706/g.46568  ORF Transcript_25706/g.46568 Transcript_25706/m.46568 type:complete len:128 (+) Transcript_25706:89-472(+)
MTDGHQRVILVDLAILLIFKIMRFDSIRCDNSNKKLMRLNPDGPVPLTLPRSKRIPSASSPRFIISHSFHCRKHLPNSAAYTSAALSWQQSESESCQQRCESRISGSGRQTATLRVIGFLRPTLSTS